MRKKRLLVFLTGSALVLIALALASVQPALRMYWRVHSANSVRRGVEVARRLGCFSCHGDLGSKGLPDPGGPGTEVPAWSSGMWMMYVEDPTEVREFILRGVSRRRAASESARKERDAAAIRMPGYRDLLDDREVDDLVKAFQVLSGMGGPAEPSARRGLALAHSRRCFSCHGPGGSGGLSNPRSFTGFVPGWYGPDFRDLVRGREEFDAWIRRGDIPRLTSDRWASYFMRRQKLRMPAYRDLGATELDDLWRYFRWLEVSAGGVEAGPGTASR